MKSVQIDEDILQFLQSKVAAPGESMSDVLRRELQLPTIEIDDDLYDYLISRTQQIGESASTILRRELDLTPGPDPDDHHGDQGPVIVTFHIPAGTHAHPWNTAQDPVRAKVGDTLQIVNDDSVPHRPHTTGVPFPHPAADIQPGQSASYVLTAPFGDTAAASLYDHDQGTTAAFWLLVLAVA
jgi:predicted CopG family antitoxin